MFRMDSNLVPYMTMLAVAWGLCGAGVVFVAPLIQWRITNRESGSFFPPVISLIVTCNRY